MTTSKAKNQLSPRQSGLGCSTSQVGRKVKAAIQNTHLAAAQEAGSVGGRLSQRRQKEVGAEQRPKPSEAILGIGGPIEGQVFNEQEP